MYKVVISFFLCLTFTAVTQAQGLTNDDRTVEYLPLLKNKRVALLVNQTATIGQTHLIDSLLKLRVEHR